MIKNTISIIIITNSIVDNSDKIKNVFKFMNNNIINPTYTYITKCYCIVCEYNRKNNLKQIH